MEYNIHNRLINLADCLENTEENKELKKELINIAEDVRVLTYQYQQALQEKYKR